MNTYLFICYNGKTQNAQDIAKLVTVEGTATKKEAQAIVQRNFPKLNVNTGWSYKNRPEAEARAKEVIAQHGGELTHINAGMQRSIANLLGI